MKFFILLTGLFCFLNANADLTLYTDRPTARMQVVADEFFKSTNIKVNIVEIPWAEMSGQLKQEGPSSPADVIFLKDSVYLNNLVKQGGLAKMQSSYVRNNVDASMYNDYYTAITYRARTLVYESSLDVSSINSYADLAKPDYAGTLCLRTSKSQYNQALTGTLINRYGYNETKTMLAGWLKNMVDPTVFHKDDNAVISDVAAGKCALGITNSYYLGLAMAKNPSIPVSIKFLDQTQGGVHTNGMGAGVSSTSKQPAVAQQFVEFMLSEGIQKYLTGEQMDFPANKNVALPSTIKSWNSFKMNSQNWSATTDSAQKAVELFSEIGYL
jgi:iron(III) transport system substrate-binding protein